jgi:hypothetical protein
MMLWVVVVVVAAAAVLGGVVVVLLLACLLQLLLHFRPYREGDEEDQAVLQTRTTWRLRLANRTEKN